MTDTKPTPCIGADPLCPCQDGDACHYKDTPKTKGFPLPEGAVMRLARMLKLYIAAEGLEQKKVAEEIGIGESTLSRFMSGAALPAADSFARVLAWCSGASVPPSADALDRIERLEAQVGTLDTRTGGLVRIGGR